MNICVAFPVLTFFVALTSGVSGETVTEYSIMLDPDEKFNVTWSFTGREPDDMITFSLQVETTGWIGLGFSPQGSMAGADIVIAWVRADGRAFLRDMMAEGNSLPSQDTSEDVTLVSAKESNGKTMVTFKRKLNTCDGRDLPLKMDTTKLIYAYGSEDPKDDTLTSSAYHGDQTRGTKSIYLFDPVPPASNVPEDALTFDITVNQYTIPSNDTTYHCSFHPAPELSQKHHLIGVKPVVTPGNEAIVHHAVLYGCWNLTLEHLRGSNKTSGICRTAEMPEFESSCRIVVFAWAIGGGDFYFPEGTGYPLGTGDLESPEFFMMEMHYDNPSEKSGLVDSSGLKLIYTPTLRAIDVGVLEMGISYGIIVPPKMAQFEISGYCHRNCTESALPEEGVTVFSYFLHAHLLGVKIRIEIYKDDGLVELLAADDNYDFNFQENRLFSEPKKLYPGDTLKITCSMDSTSRVDVTVGGLSTREEMCLAFLGYYPRKNINNCITLPSYVVNPVHRIYSTLNVKAEMSTLLPNLIDLETSLDNISWTDELISKTQDIVNEDTQLKICMLDKSQQPSAPSFFDPAPFSGSAAPEPDFCIKSNAGGPTDGGNQPGDGENSAGRFTFFALTTIICILALMCHL